MIDPGFFAVLAGYLLGSIPFGLLLSKMAGQGDVRDIGSGNIGATNVLRTGKKGLAAATLLMDIGKGVGAVLLANYLNPDYAAMAGFAAFLGHVFPVWLKFKGGKGVATFVGVLLALNWMVGLAALLAWVLVAAVFKTSSLASLTASVAGPFLAYFLVSPQASMWVFLMTFVIILAHRANIKRLLNGIEPKIGSKSQK